MKSSKKVALLGMTIVFVFLFAASSALAAGYCSEENKAAKNEAKGYGIAFCTPQIGLADYYFSGAECMSGICYQYFTIVCKDNRSTEYETTVIATDCRMHGGGGGGGGGDECRGWPCPISCQWCVPAR